MGGQDGPSELPPPLSLSSFLSCRCSSYSRSPATAIVSLAIFLCLSSPCSPILLLSLSLSLPCVSHGHLPLCFFLTFSWQHNTIRATGGPLPSTHRGNQLSGCRSEGGNSLTAKLPPLADVDGEWEATEEWQ